MDDADLIAAYLRIEIRPPIHHLEGPDLAWFEFDPSPFVRVVERHSDTSADLADRLRGCRRAAWKCDSVIVFRDPTPHSGGQTVVLWEGLRGHDLVIDCDVEGAPMSIEFLDRLPCRSDSVRRTSVKPSNRGLLGRLFRRNRPAEHLNLK